MNPYPQLWITDDSGGRKEADKTLVQDSPMYSMYIHVHIYTSIVDNNSKEQHNHIIVRGTREVTT